MGLSLKHFIGYNIKLTSGNVKLEKVENWTGLENFNELILACKIINNNLLGHIRYVTESYLAYVFAIYLQMYFICSLCACILKYISTK